ncbi:hypothetical protein EGJ28_16260 [Stutzerimonas xanthomarina]|jgi:hypothetical protein|uniref:Uncharacterized protein n=1 Tax=Stutzerimonas xanthomarina TaxID=271420 RepID=A0A3R8VD48_9GAMM|nr:MULTISPECIES: hypothetical protein [Stutzerimonas]MBK3919960.1 hypothetical protein [Stutzerimonas frequens]RRV08820.1 hypothetical protein EGJ28_16260 [Stutzerimonas xanthomarina]
MQLDYHTKALRRLAEIGVHILPSGQFAFTDVGTASEAYVHHSTVPAALAAYAAVNPTFAGGRFPGLTLTAIVDKVPCMDGEEYTALALACGAEVPTFESSGKRLRVFGQTLLDILERYELYGCFERVKPYGSEGHHYSVRPIGFDWGGSWAPVPERMKAMRKCYRSMTPLQQVITLTVLHLYRPERDTHFLIGGCPTKILAADAMKILHSNGAAADWGRLVSHYAGW